MHGAATLTVYAFIGGDLSSDFPLAAALEVFIRREDAERFSDEVREDEPELAAKRRIVERVLEGNGLN